jgi:hypothetical protein
MKDTDYEGIFQKLDNDDNDFTRGQKKIKYFTKEN